MQITNNSDISLALAVWLVHDDYDYDADPNYISATSLLKPIRHIVLPRRLPPEARTMDVSDQIKKKLGSALHDSIEKAWTEGYVESLMRLGIAEDVIERVKINPSDKEVRASNSIIPIYLERREKRKLNGKVIGGKFDMVAEGILQDTKSTSVWTWVNERNVDAYQLQMSIYRWLDAGRELRRVTEDYGVVNFIFPDWSAGMVKTPNYPQQQVEKKIVPLLSLHETEAWIASKLLTVTSNLHVPEALLPRCTEEELWMSDPVYKYYGDPTKTTGKSTKNFETLAAATQHKADKGKGVVIPVPGAPKRCAYCDAFSICTQKDEYFND